MAVGNIIIGEQGLLGRSRGAPECFTKPIAMVHEIRTYTELRQQIHDDLRIQHPEWIEPNGGSRMCDAYDARLTQLLDAIDANGIQRVNRC